MSNLFISFETVKDPFFRSVIHFSTINHIRSRKNVGDILILTFSFQMIFTSAVLNTDFNIMRMNSL